MSGNRKSRAGEVAAMHVASKREAAAPRVAGVAVGEDGVDAQV